MEAILTTDGLISLLTLTAMEIVLGVDNIIFIAILVAKLPASQQNKARTLGIGLALVSRLLLLLSISWVMGLTEPLFTVFSQGFSGRDLILLLGGLFLLGKATVEIHEKLESGPTGPRDTGKGGAKASFASILIQIIILDIVFSLDSVITAVGMAQHISIMVVAMVVAVAVMMLSARAIGDFVHRHPTIKILALSFLILIGVVLVGEGMGAHVNKGYIYFAMAFSLGVELLNMKIRQAKKPVELKEPRHPS
jgi:predicted tellurium resistance membrane protein TerC